MKSGDYNTYHLAAGRGRKRRLRYPRSEEVEISREQVDEGATHMGQINVRYDRSSQERLFVDRQVRTPHAAERCSFPLPDTMARTMARAASAHEAVAVAA